MKKYIVLWIIASFFCGCDSFLTVQPKSDIKDIDLFSTAEGCEDALYGIYSELGGEALYGKNMTYYIPEVLAQSFDNQVTTANDGFYQIKNYEHNKNGARSEYNKIWTSMYRAIGHVNNIISNLERVGNGVYKYYNYYLGEALGVRAYLHFDLVRLFAPHIASQPSAQAIPYAKAWEAKITPFSTVEQVYKQVISDLRQSETLLEEAELIEKSDKSTFLNQRELHFNLDAARATLARVYWMKGDSDSAGIYATKVIETQKYPLATMSEIRSLVAGVVAKEEAIWGIFQNDPLHVVAKTFYNGAVLWFPRSDIHAFYTNEGSFNDMRQYWYRARVSTGSGNDIYFLKLFNEDAYIDGANYTYTAVKGMNMIRIPEMYLIAAESLLESDPVKATVYFDKVAESRGRQGLNKNDRQVTLQDINEERFREYFGEGYEWYNMKRQNRDLYIPSTMTTVKGTDELYTLTIPDDEFDYRYMDE